MYKFSHINAITLPFQIDIQQRNVWFFLFQFQNGLFLIISNTSHFVIRQKKPDIALLDINLEGERALPRGMARGKEGSAVAPVVYSKVTPSTEPRASVLSGVAVRLR